MRRILYLWTREIQIVSKFHRNIELYDLGWIMFQREKFKEIISLKTFTGNFKRWLIIVLLILTLKVLINCRMLRYNLQTLTNSVDLLLCSANVLYELCDNETEDIEKMRGILITKFQRKLIQRCITLLLFISRNIHILAMKLNECYVAKFN